MFCEKCGSLLEQDATFCSDCGTDCAVEQSSKTVETAGSTEEWSRETHWTHFWNYFVKGLIGCAIGAVLAIAMGSPAGILYLGLAFAGVPYGWNLITRVTDGWSLYGSVVMLVLYAMIKLLLSLLIGITVYPPLLFYHLMMSQKPKSIAQTFCIVLFALSIIGSLLVVSGLIMK